MTIKVPQTQWVYLADGYKSLFRQCKGHKGQIKAKKGKILDVQKFDVFMTTSVHNIAIDT